MSNDFELWKASVKDNAHNDKKRKVIFL